MTASTQPEHNALALSGTSSTGLVLSNETMDKAFRMAELMASGRSTVPKHLQGSAADCMAVTLQALQWNMSPFAVAQKTHIVNGTLGYEAQLVNAVLQSTGAIAGEFDYEYRGGLADLECRVGATPRGKTAVKWGEWLSIKEVTIKNSPLWKTNPKQQMGYLQVKNWARAFKPGAILGVYTADELESPPITPIKDMGPVEEVPAMFDPARFDANLPKWRAAIAAGKAKPEGIIAKARTLGALTPEQEARITAPITEAEQPAKQAEAVTDVQPKDATPAASTTPAVTFAMVNDQMQKAQDIDTLFVAADLIGEVADPQQRSELTAIFEQRQAAMVG